MTGQRRIGNPVAVSGDIDRSVHILSLNQEFFSTLGDYLLIERKSLAKNKISEMDLFESFQ